MLDYVIEHVDKLPLSSDDKLDLFRILAEMCPFCTEFDRPKERLGKLFNVLMVGNIAGDLFEILLSLNFRHFYLSHRWNPKRRVVM